MSHQTVTVAERWDTDAALPVGTATVTGRLRRWIGERQPRTNSCCPPWRIVSTFVPDLTTCC